MSSVWTNTVTGRPAGVTPAFASSSSMVRNAFLRLSTPSSQVLVPESTAAGFAGRVTSATSDVSAEGGTSVGRPAVAGGEAGVAGALGPGGGAPAPGGGRGALSTGAGGGA